MFPEIAAGQRKHVNTEAKGLYIPLLIFNYPYFTTNLSRPVKLQGGDFFLCFRCILYKQVHLGYVFACHQYCPLTFSMDTVKYSFIGGGRCCFVINVLLTTFFAELNYRLPSRPSPAAQFLALISCDHSGWGCSLLLSAKQHLLSVACNCSADYSIFVEHTAYKFVIQKSLITVKENSYLLASLTL